MTALLVSAVIGLATGSAAAEQSQKASPTASSAAPAPTPAASAPAPGLPDSVIDARTTAIASQLRCPVCQGLSIQDSPSELSQQMRAIVKEQVAAGKSDDEIRNYFIGRYGEWILLAPRARGFNLLAYALPLALLLGGAALIAVNVRRWASPPDAASPGAADNAAGAGAAAPRE
ncbi:MAG TPA: cytochrome c-type biogenesis protein CcmH [Gemmatimonadaceae bacterium]|nr:cytochrome c-type biogenesis protein CcmH [Gemmatimonadaceae bacterium]